MAEGMIYYEDRDCPGLVYKYDWSNNTGYGWHYKKNGWVENPEVIDHIYNYELRIVSEEEAMKAIQDEIDGKNDD